MYAVLDPSDATEYNDVLTSITWSSENLAIAEVSETGIVKGISEGTTTVHITTKMSPSIYLGYAEITVKVPVQEILMERQELEMLVGDTYNFVAMLLPGNATNKEVLWSSSNEEIAIVNEQGQITAKKDGEAVISVSSVDDPTKFGVVRVVVKSVPVEEMVLNASTITIYAGQSYLLTATIVPENATNKEIIWQTSNSAVASVENGTIHGVNVGEADITAIGENGTKKSICKVIVVEDPSSQRRFIENVPYIGTTSTGYVNGHEVASATMALRFSGYNISPKNIVDNLPMGSEKYKDGNGNWFGANPFESFVGNPSSNLASGSYGCFATPLAQSMQNFAGSRVKNISGCDESTLFSYIDQNKPVVVWCTQGGSNLSYGETWTYVNSNKQVVGGTFQELIGKHCALLVGYDSEIVYLHDPAINTYVTQPKSKFINNWKILHSQAIVIE